MKQFVYGVILYVFLMMPPVIELTESIMSIHMHMQMPFLAIVGLLMYPQFKKWFPTFFHKWNENGIPGMLLFFIIVIYWLFPRTMDEALMSTSVELFKFISWPFLVGIPLRDSWSKLTDRGKTISLSLISGLYFLMGFIYIFTDEQLCNNYLIVEQIALGWGFLIIAISLTVYILQSIFIDYSQYE